MIDVLHEHRVGFAGREHADRFRRRTGGTKFILNSPPELLALYNKAEDRESPNLLIQE